VRFGTFEYFHYAGEREAVRELADATIERYFAEAAAQSSGARYALFLREVAIRTARLIAQWQAAGFEHGVLNTDNMSVLGLTIDYGPFGFMEAYDPGWVCNHSDDGGRYAFDRQPAIGLWNCGALGIALSSLLSEADVRDALEAYAPAFEASYAQLLRAKFGLREELPGDAALFADALRLLADARGDYPGFFRALCALEASRGPGDAALDARFAEHAGWPLWRERYRARLAQERVGAVERRATMQRLQAVLRRPFDEQPENDAYAEPPPEGTPPLVIGCSS
jgi:uncharacterized protein YdiU (UPF0061 family)